MDTTIAGKLVMLCLGGAFLAASEAWSGEAGKPPSPDAARRKYIESTKAGLDKFCKTVKDWKIRETDPIDDAADPAETDMGNYRLDAKSTLRSNVRETRQACLKLGDATDGLPALLSEDAAPGHIPLPLWNRLDNDLGQILLSYQGSDGGTSTRSSHYGNNYYDPEKKKRKEKQFDRFETINQLAADSAIWFVPFVRDGSLAQTVQESRPKKP